MFEFFHCVHQSPSPPGPGLTALGRGEHTTASTFPGGVSEFFVSPTITADSIKTCPVTGES
jgi:hypothetical protein